MDNAQLINQDSGDTEYLTPREIVAVARQLMGGIDLDPACEYEAAVYQGYGPETLYFGKEQNGLSQVWANRVWMNHPFSRAENHLWIGKLVAGYQERAIPQACCITFASVSEAWCQPLLANGMQFFFRGRINYIDPVTGQPKRGATKGSMFTWLYNHEEIGASRARFLLTEVMTAAGFQGVAK